MAHCTERCTTAGWPMVARCLELTQTAVIINCSTFSAGLPVTVRSPLLDLLRAWMARCTERPAEVAQEDSAPCSGSAQTPLITRSSLASVPVMVILHLQWCSALMARYMGPVTLVANTVTAQSSKLLQTA